ncbi:MAG TPA: hypothetical protein VNS79_04945 [Sphingobium sp.]|nr:hypothetical protein [Sphingobium sp.]
MRIKRPYRLLGLSALALAIPVLAQGPESLLPEGFGEPTPAAPAPRPQPAPTPTPTPSAPVAPSAPSSAVPATTAALNEAAGVLPDAANATAGDEIAEKYDLPRSARRSLDVIGPLTPELGGLGPNAFGRDHGKDLAAIMAATRAPFLSRWGSILLRRALLTQSDTPRDIGGADWAAERAWLLLRMGEADNGRLLIQSVDSDHYTKRLYAVAMQAQLATADPAGLCPLLPRAASFTDEPGWFMAQAICAAFSADQGTATALLSQAQRRGIAHSVDYRLAEKIVGAGPNSRRSVKIEWDGVSALTSWRFGLATAANVAIPDALYAGAGPQVRAWEARAPALTLAQRVPGAAVATRLGVFSGAASLDFYSALAGEPDADEAATARGDLLRMASAGPSASERIGAMRRLWTTPSVAGEWSDTDGVHYGNLPVLARAAAALPPTAAAGAETPWLIAAMLAGGYDGQAARWSGAVNRLDGAARERSWALLATGLPSPQLDLSRGRIEAFVTQDEGNARQLGRSLVAALAGLGRLPGDARAQLLRDNAIETAPKTRWQRALMAAADRREAGTVALLAAVGMQGASWRALPPEHLYFIVTALDRVGLNPYARMIAAEAMARIA